MNVEEVLEGKPMAVAGGCGEDVCGRGFLVERGTKAVIISRWQKGTEEGGTLLEFEATSISNSFLF